MTVELNTLLKLIPVFDTKERDQVYRFIRSCDSAFKLASEEDTKIILVYALNNITGTGASDVHAKQYDSWDSLKTFLIERFSNVKTIPHLNIELQSMFQGPTETLTEYFHRIDLCRSKLIEKLNAEITDKTLLGRLAATEETALNVFINGLSSDMGMMLRTKGFTSLTEAGHFAMQEDKIRSMNHARQSLFRASNTNPRSTANTNFKPTANRVFSNTRQPTFQPRPTSSSQATRPALPQPTPNLQLL